MPAYAEDMCGALILMLTLRDVKNVTLAHEYHIVEFEGTTATLMIDAREVSRETIDALIDEARAERS